MSTAIPALSAIFSDSSKSSSAPGQNPAPSPALATEEELKAWTTNLQHSQEEIKTLITESFKQITDTLSGKLDELPTAIQGKVKQALQAEKYLEFRGKLNKRM